MPCPGDTSVGVARPSCNQPGKIGNGQVGGLAACARGKGDTLLDRRLYIPDAWCGEDYAAHRQRGGLPEEVAFQTQRALASAMLAGLGHRKEVALR
ncbi:MAG: transposase [Armatimonadetes bacterium]|nr:transposase [Armatimonadota bacterium]